MLFYQLFFTHTAVSKKYLMVFRVQVKSGTHKTVLTTFKMDCKECALLEKSNLLYFYNSEVLHTK